MIHRTPRGGQGRVITLIARFLEPTWANQGPTRPRWARYWPHEPCYLGNAACAIPQLLLVWYNQPCMVLASFCQNIPFLTLEGLISLSKFIKMRWLAKLVHLYSSCIFFITWLKRWPFSGAVARIFKCALVQVTVWLEICHRYLCA